ncbi:MAG: methyltransferase domain-containing protein [Bacteroidetes bacterium]|jgi:SAM-dependent methyltransferase|nr:methyltransferase domain-containing protein [Bacteroidota bacterium]
MKSELTENEIRELEIQLSCPFGETGIEIGKNLNETNIGMILNSIEFLELRDENVVLELGHGNCGHLDRIFEIAREIKYYGLEISETMWNESQNRNATKQAKFELYDGENIPYNDKFFDRIMSVNTIYFWSDPIKLIREIERTLKPNGVCVLTYGDKEFMQKLPVVGEIFKLYGKNEIKDLVETTNLGIIDFKDKTEQVKGNTGEVVERRYSMAKLKGCS